MRSWSKSSKLTSRDASTSQRNNQPAKVLRWSPNGIAVKTVKLSIKRSPGTEDLAMPAYMSAGAAGMDLCADVRADETIAPGEIKLIPTGISISVPPGYEAQIRPRSGLALKHGLTLVNTPGTIDSDYR